MLRVTAILEGGLDLEKGEEIPRSMVVTNGKTSVTVPIPQEKVQALVGLFAEELGHTIKEPEPLRVAPIKVEARKIQQTRPLFEEEPDITPPMPVVDESGMQPGEDYDDSGTGVSSL